MGFGSRHARTIKVNFALFTQLEASPFAQRKRGQAVGSVWVRGHTGCRVAAQILHSRVVCFCIWSGWMNEEKFYEGRCDKQFTDGEPCLFLLLTTFVFPSNTIRSRHMSFFNLVLIQPTFYLPDNIEGYVNLKLFFNL